MPIGTHLEATLLFAAVFGILHVILTMRVGVYRKNHNINVGDGGDTELLKRMRGHGNYVENVPMGLMLLLLNELNGLSQTHLIILGSVLLFGRLAHYAQLALGAPLILRPIGMLATVGMILTSATLLVF